MNVAPLRSALVLPRPTTWHLFVLLLVLALAREYWDKDPAALGPVRLPWPTFLVAFTLLPLIVPPREWRRLDAVWLRIPATIRPLLLFWMACGLSVGSVLVAPGASSVQDFARTFVHLTVYVVFVIALVKWMTWWRLAVLVWTYYAMGLAAAGLAVLQYLHGTFGVFGWMAPLMFQSAEYEVAAGVTTGFRASSFFGEPSWAARYYVHFMALALAFWWHRGERRHLAAVGLLLAAFYAANSLLGYVILGTFAATAVLAQMWRRNAFSLSQRSKILFGLGLYGCLLLWVADLLPRAPDLLERSIHRIGLVLQGGGGAGNRIDSVFAGLEVWRMAPVLGIGMGNIDAYIVPFYQDPAWVLRSHYVSDSLYVQLLAEVGLAGLAAFLWFWARLLWFSAPKGFGAHAEPHEAQTYVILRFLQLDLLAQAVGMLNASDYLNPHLWTVVAIVLACKTLLIRSGARALRTGGPLPFAATAAPA